MRQRLKSSVAGALLFPLIVAGCAKVGPDYQPPQVQTPIAWSEAAAGPESGETDLRNWWQGFGDPLLEDLVAQAVAGNLDLQMAARRVIAAKADRVAIAAGGLPTLGAGVSAANSRSSEMLTWPPGVGEYKTYQYGLESSWELDVFGGTRRAVEAADAASGAAAEDRRGIMVALLGDLASDYTLLRFSQKRLEIAHRNIAAEQKALELSERAYKAGLGTDMDVARARAAVETSQSQIPPLEANIARMGHAIALLLGRFPGDLKADGVLARLVLPLPKDLVLPPLPGTLPSEMVRNRPDIRRAERQIAAATARVGVATAELFPHFKIPLGIGPMTSNMVNLLESDALVWTFGLSATQTLYDGGKSNAHIRAAEAVAEQDRLAYRQTILQAFREVEDRLVGYRTEQDRHASLVAAAADEAQAFDRATRLYASGLTDFLKVLDSERALFHAEDSLAQSEQAQALDLIGLYRALGGGWQEADREVASTE